MAKNDVHGWMRDRLADQGRKASEVARAWGVDDAVVSRYIKSGEPKITLERMELLAPILNMTFEELRVRFATRPIPPEALQAIAAAEPTNTFVSSSKRDEEWTNRVAIFLASVKAARQFLPSDVVISVSLQYANGDAL